MTALHPSYPPLPDKLAHLAIDDEGRPVPWFVAYVDGKPDFRIADARKLVLAILEKRCWMCGAQNGSYRTFPVGPMCTVNRVSSEPPCHLACATYAVQACPFLLNGRRKRRETDMPEGAEWVSGCPIKRNPGVMALWTTKRPSVFDDGTGAPLFDIGDPEHVTWWKGGRAATRAEVEESIATGIPQLRALAAVEGPKAVAMLAKCERRARLYLPAAVAEVTP